MGMTAAVIVHWRELHVDPWPLISHNSNIVPTLPPSSTTTMFAAIAAAILPRRFTRNAIASAVTAALVPVAAAPTVLRADRRTRTPNYEMSSNRVRFGFTESKCFDIRENSIAVSQPFTIEVRPIINKRALKELEGSLDGAYWSTPVAGGRIRRAPVRYGNA